jgi:hypothetical protein
VPIARVEPLQSPDSRLSAPATEGAVMLPERELDVEDFLDSVRPSAREGSSAVAIVPLLVGEARTARSVAFLRSDREIVPYDDCLSRAARREGFPPAEV